MSTVSTAIHASGHVETVVLLATDTIVNIIIDNTQTVLDTTGTFTAARTFEVETAYSAVSTPGIVVTKIPVAIVGNKPGLLGATQFTTTMTTELVLSPIDAPELQATAVLPTSTESSTGASIQYHSPLPTYTSSPSSGIHTHEPSRVPMLVSAIVGSVALFLGLLALLIWAHRRRRRYPHFQTLEEFPADAESHSRPARKAIQDARPQWHSFPMMDEKAKPASRPDVDDTGDVSAQLDAPVSLPRVPDERALETTTDDRQAGPSNMQRMMAKEEVERMFAALKGEIHRLRVEIMQRNEREDAERPPSYD